jgi:TetR/AcrR family transcriptional regulator
VGKAETAVARHSVEAPDAANDDRRTRILSAAVELMSERGFDGTSVQAIADHAAVNKALIFYYFGNKTQLFAQIFEHYLGGLHAGLQQAMASFDEAATTKAEGARRLHAVVDAYIDYIERNPSYPRVVQRELANSQGRHDLLATYNARNYELVRKAMAPFALPEDGPAAPHQLFASVVGMVLYYHLSAPVMAPLIPDPLGADARQARRRHVHWVVDGLIVQLAADPPAG